MYLVWAHEPCINCGVGVLQKPVSYFDMRSNHFGIIAVDQLRLRMRTVLLRYACVHSTAFTIKWTPDRV